MRTLAWCALATLLFSTSACTSKVTGPTPSIEKPHNALPIDPGIACRAQLTTDVTVHGQNFSPIAIDIPKDPKVALPTVTLLKAHALDGGAGDDSKIVYSGNPDDPTNLSLLSWSSQKQLQFAINQEVTLAPHHKGEIPVGLYDVQVDNPNGNQTKEPRALAIVDKPELTTVTPTITCLAQGARTIDISGTTLLEVEGAQPTLDIENVATGVTPDSLTGCTDIHHEGLSAKYCTGATLTLAKDSVDPGYPALTVKNPETAACTSEETVNLRVVPPPVITRVVDPLACVAQGARSFTIEGSAFLQIDGTNPNVTIGGSAFPVDSVGTCDDLPTMGHSVKTCKALSITVPQDALMEGNPDIVVVNPDPAGCQVSNSVALTIVPPPTVTDVVPPLICVDDHMQALDIVGTDFLTVDGELPTVAIAGTDLPATAVSVDDNDCVDLAVQGLMVKKCSKLTVTVAKNGLDIGAPDVMVTNPDPAGCSDTQSDLLTVVNGPSVTAATPALVCTDDQSRSIVLTGTNLLKVGNQIPTVTLDGFAVTGTIDDADCTPVAVHGLSNVSKCTAMTLAVPMGTLAPGDTEVAIKNPDPAGCAIIDTMVLTVPPELTITSAQPTNACVNSGAYDVIVQGTGFLRVDGTDFTVQVAGNDVTPTGIGGCTAVDVAGMMVQSCTRFHVSIDSDTVAVGDVAIAVTNPDPADSGCAASDSTLFRIVGPPTIASVLPSEICSDTATTLTITGTNFAPGTTVTAGSTAADTVDVTSDTQLTATFTNGLPAGSYDITVETAPSCNSTASAALVVDPTPLVFFVDPPVL
ncbi:MAG TPA: IPT/TIG domain-containing protein, partial [Polyangiaceae bacterium]|nr:IPT/TIG domain-containing protein [Polyangiaceae bacterium]